MTIKEKLKAEFVNGRTLFDWIFLGVGIALQLVAIWVDYMAGTPDNWVTILSGITGIISVVLCAQGKLSFYIFGYIQLFSFVFGIAIPYKLWGEVGENVFYFVTMVYGMVVWIKNYGVSTTDSAEIKAKKLTLKGWIGYTAFLIFGTLALALILSVTNDPQPWMDSITTIAPAVGQVLLMFGYREQWVFWIIEDIMSMVMFAMLGSWIMFAQYLFWTINCIYGWIKWTESNKEFA